MSKPVGIDQGLIANPVAFWEKRHANFDPWRSGGDRGLSQEENYEFYAYRLGRIIELIQAIYEWKATTARVGCRMWPWASD